MALTSYRNSGSTSNWLAVLTYAKDQYNHGMISMPEVEAAENKEEDAKADLEGAKSRLKQIAVDKDHPGSTTNVTRRSQAFSWLRR
jgi:hypothetical protein